MDNCARSRTTIHRHLAKAGLVEPAPKKRPRSSYIRFEAAMPNECWQADFTHYRLADGSDTEILTWLDDCTRYALSVTAHERVTGPITQGTFRTACEAHGVPASTLTDNGLVFTTRLAGGRGGKNALEHELARLGVVQKNSRPNHPTTCGKVERFQQTMKKHLAAQSPQPATLADLQALIDAFTSEYNERRPHRSLPHRAAPAAVYTTRPKAAPGDACETAEPGRIRTDTVDKAGSVTLRHNGKLASDASTKAPASCSSSKASTSASSTPPPAHSFANSPSTPTATTNPPAVPKAQPDLHSKTGRTFAGSTCFRCPATSHCRDHRGLWEFVSAGQGTAHPPSARKTRQNDCKRPWSPMSHLSYKTAELGLFATRSGLRELTALVPELGHSLPSVA
ncbi:integrase core domain-containing protein [Glycomyces luteolus]|uniref:Integrase core domain-containing protein n=1 Tax=Glycomyces luteolus TaxID=2670330 RepID=A0A9X3PB59_9ACTN|nr:integrase core domain-containing protein [Glycomyces luteolus]MDA1362178.1 integrase core domain-containing protein [Glycomyces luteolus]